MNTSVTVNGVTYCGFIISRQETVSCHKCGKLGTYVTCSSGNSVDRYCIECSTENSSNEPLRDAIMEYCGFSDMQDTLRSLGRVPIPKCNPYRTYKTKISRQSEKAERFSPPPSDDDSYKVLNLPLRFERID